MRRITIRSVRTWPWAKTRRWVGQSSGPAPLSPSQSCPACTTITSGYDFRKGQDMRNTFLRWHPEAKLIMMDCGHCPMQEMPIYLQTIMEKFVRYLIRPAARLRDLVPVASLMRVPNVMDVSPTLPAKTVPEVIAYAKANPGKVMFLSSARSWDGLCASKFVAAPLFLWHIFRRLALVPSFVAARM